MSALLGRLQASLGAIAGVGRERIRIHPFSGYVDHVRTPKYFSFALPDPGAGSDDLAAALPELRAAYADRGRVARTEFFVELSPGLEALLLADRWTLSERMPVMVCTPETFTDPPPSDGLTVELLSPATEEAVIREFLSAQRVAFDDDSAITAEELARWRERAATQVNAAGLLDGAVAGTAFCSPVFGGVTEVGGVATVPQYRRRGIAAALTASVVAQAFSSGAELAWLTASGESAQAIYGRAGFTPAGTLLAYDAPG